MDIGVIGLGCMGGNLAQRLVCGEHRVVGFDPDMEARKRVGSKGVETVDSLEALLLQLSVPRVLWLMVAPGRAVDQMLSRLMPLLAKGDTVVDGGNSHYQQTQRRADVFTKQQIHYVDCGTSGGVWGLENGYRLMIGGDVAVVERLSPLFETLATARGQGWSRVGCSGAGHYAKMIRSDIEYDLMQSFAEGYSILDHKSELAFDLQQSADIWRCGSVVRCWLLELISMTLEKNPELIITVPQVKNSDEGRWTVAEAIALHVPIPVITLSLLEHLRSPHAGPHAKQQMAALMPLSENL